MCIINEPADVSKTQIFVSSNQRGDRQFTCYSNAVMTESDNNVMILPVRRPQTVLFHDLSEYKNLFKDLEESFVEHFFGFDDGRGLSRCVDKEKWVPVQDLGSYRVSLAMCHEELDKIDPREFGQINAHIKHILGKYYGQGSGGKVGQEWGFVVCKLAPGKLREYHPLAYSNAIIPGEKLFVPTRHQHNHAPAPASHVNHAHVNHVDVDQVDQDQEERISDWDHAIYSFNTSCSCGNRGRVNNDVYLDRKKIRDFIFPNTIDEFQKLRIKGRGPNKDYFFQVVC